MSGPRAPHSLRHKPQSTPLKFEGPDSLGQAKRRTEEYAESQLFEGNANGAKFNLTNNHGWVEKTVQEHEGGFFGTGGASRSRS